MEFRTPVKIDKCNFTLNHKQLILSMGSCFSENIGKKLFEQKFRIDINPFGVLYNPCSIASSLRILADRRTFSENDLFSRDGIMHSYAHHSRFSHPDTKTCLQQINERIISSSANLATLDCLMVTFGTAYVYKLKETGTIVANCHKMPDKLFVRERLSADNIINEWSNLIDTLRKQNPRLNILFTVSPIRHLRDGAHGNQLSKATLLLAIEQLTQSIPNTFYFPAYEILMDELRDYRFYAADMTHPSDTTIQYLWERFCETYFTKETQTLVNIWNKLRLSLIHRPFSTESSVYKDFIMQNLLKLEKIRKKYPYFDVTNEIEQIQTQLTAINSI